MYTNHAHRALHQAWLRGTEGALVAALRVLAKALESTPWDARLWAVYLPLYALRAGSPGAQLHTGAHLRDCFKNLPLNLKHQFSAHAALRAARRLGECAATHWGHL